MKETVEGLGRCLRLSPIAFFPMLKIDHQSQKMKDYLYAPPRRYRTIEIIHDALVKAGKIKPSRQRRFLSPKEAQKLKTEWRECKHVSKFLALAKLRRCNFLNYQYFMNVYEEDPACDMTIQDYIIQETRCCMHGVRELLREKEMSFGVQ